MDIVFNACIKELESNTPKCDFSWGGRFCPPPRGSQGMKGPWAIGLKKKLHVAQKIMNFSHFYKISECGDRNDPRIT